VHEPAIETVTPEVRLWLSTSELPPDGGAIVMCLINSTNTEFRTGLGGRFEVADGPVWAFFGSFSARPAYWNSLGTVWIGPHSGMSPAIGFAARPGEIGQAEYLMVPALEPNRYRFSHQDGPGSPVGPDGEVRKAHGEFEVSESAPAPVPIENKVAAGGGMSAHPLLLPPSGGQISIEGFSSRGGVHQVLRVGFSLQPWADGKWGAPSLSLTPRQLTEYPFGLAVDFPPLPVGAFRISCKRPDLGEIGRVVWVVEGLSGT